MTHPLAIRDTIAIPRPGVRIGAAAQILGVSRKTVRMLGRRGLPHWRSPGGQRRFDRAFLEALAAEVDGQERLPMEVPS